MNKIPSALQLGVRRGGLEIRQFARQRESVVFTLLFPVILLAIFGSVFKDTIAPGVTFSQYFVAGMIASGLETLAWNPNARIKLLYWKSNLDLCKYGHSDSLTVGLWCAFLWP
jgi:hypothetical protein